VVKVLGLQPWNVQAADLLLRLHARRGAVPAQDMLDLQVPAPLRPLWEARVFEFLAGLGAPEALELWPRLDAACLGEHHLNLAAEAMVRADERAAGAALYRRSLALDPLQAPVRLRLQELLSPTLPDHGLLHSRRVAVCLYSWNKADLLEHTLRSLAGTALGAATVLVLLNGCTDHSRDVAERAREWFPRNDFRVIELPVNVGAPAARNWLIAQPECRGADHVAFLDDDVTLEHDWLAHFLTQAARDERIGVVGARIVGPEEPATLQYLYRTPSVVRTDLIRISLDAPNFQRDTGLYGFVRDTANVMGCCHLLSRGLLDALPSFDLRYSPSQMDDIAHDLEARLAGFRVVYCGLVRCVHHQNSGLSFRTMDDAVRWGNVAGNDVKFFYQFCDRLDGLRALMNRPAEEAAPPTRTMAETETVRGRA
jgi:GT2 family glycosyltransferase